ncbi:TPA_asm: P3 [Baccharis alphacytorhabdovirus 1]|nr:TPA_asm: P3 [Baccharis alphacytorhabdovirus 1]
MINVNDVRKSIVKRSSLTASVGTGTVYSGKFNRYARKRELNIIISATGDEKFMVRQVPLFDSADLDMLKSDASVNKYLHIGCITMSVEPLMHQRYLRDYGRNIRGYCMLVDSTFNKLEESIISAHQYDLQNGRADYVCFPNHCLSLTEANIQERLSVLIGFDRIDVRPGTELFNLCIGYIITGVNTLNPTGTKGITSFPINGATELDISNLLADGTTDFKQAYNKVDVIQSPSDDDIYLRSKGNFLSNVMGTTKTIKRRTMRLKIDKKTIKNEDDITSETYDKIVPHRRSFSADFDPKRIYSELRDKEVIDKCNKSLSFRMNPEPPARRMNSTMSRK